MSAYADFFIRWKDEFIPIADYSRSHEIYEIVHEFAPWEKIRAVSTNDLEKFISAAEKQINECQERVKQYQERIQLVSTFNNTVDEKLSVLSDYDEAIDELKCYINEATVAYDFFTMLAYKMIPAVKYNKNFDIDYEHYIYVGLEVDQPTMEDIVNDAT